MKFLLPFAWLYSGLIWFRNKAFDWGILKVTRVGIPVISVGNLTVGGTGKTPLVEYIVRHLLDSNYRTAVISRGYKRQSTGVVVVSDGRKLLADAVHGGDEPVQMAGKFPSVTVVVGEKRVDAARRAIELGAQIIVMDDGFQHRYLHRDLDIVVVDSTSGISKDAVLPAGRLREPLSGLGRADVIALSKVDEGTSDVDSTLRPYFTGPFVTFRYKVHSVRQAFDDATVSAEVIQRMKLTAFSGIGKHESFLNELHKYGIMPTSNMRFQDHHPYSESDISAFVRLSRTMSADGCITTEKDAVRLRSGATNAQALFGELPVFYLRIEVEILKGKEILHTLIENCGKAIPV